MPDANTKGREMEMSPLKAETTTICITEVIYAPISRKVFLVVKGDKKIGLTVSLRHSLVSFDFFDNLRFHVILRILEPLLRQRRQNIK